MYFRERAVGTQVVTFEVETITPLFLAGADQETAELRAPSFRGAMRYWLRALVGADGKDIRKVINAETAVFGATDAGSKVRVRVSQPDTTPVQFNDDITKRGGDKQQSTGKGYLLWSMKLKKPSRYYFAPDTHFQIHLTTYSTDIIKHKRGIATLWLLSHLGGIGSRSRRCAGSLTLQAPRGSTYNFSFDIAPNTVNLKKHLEQGIVDARLLFNIIGPFTDEAQFDILASKTCRIWILQEDQPWSSSEDAMRVIGESLQSYRSTIPLPQRKVFGFPLKYVKGVERRASPLMLKITKLQGNKYVCIAVLFKTPNRDVVMKDYKIIEEWITTGFPKALEVNL